MMVGCGTSRSPRMQIITEQIKNAKAQEKKIQARMKYLAEFNAKQRKERAMKARDKQNRIKQRVQAAAEMELRRKITMIRQWRANEKKRLNRLKQERESKLVRVETEANNKWIARVDAQNTKLQEEALLLQLYSEDMAAGARRRRKKSEIYAYNTDLELQRIRLANWKLMHGGTAKVARLVRKMGLEFEKSKRGAKGMSPELAQKMASEAMTNAMSTTGDTLMILGQARARMDMETVLPLAPIRILDEMLDSTIIEFARRRVHSLLLDLERVIRSQASVILFQNFKPTPTKKRNKPRWVQQIHSEMTRQFFHQRDSSMLGFGDITKIPFEDETTGELKSVKDRPPTPVPSKTKLAEVTFVDRIEDLPDPVPSFLPERKKLIEMANISARLLSKSVSQKVQKGLDITVGKVTLPPMRHPMEWGEAVEGLAMAVVDNRVNADCGDVRRTGDFLTHRILKALQNSMKFEKKSGSIPNLKNL
ncbi:hypothetical protein HW555_008230 [Spodoptera exigua]|uniref:Uncharacterized protein n=1 Tax=Spodoptera exigua TaxID=7107 RepID=A0A835L1X4_SPOEX|nr:hypothetical protein HW555_008230 [Spodoptera exigua]